MTGEARIRVRVADDRMCAWVDITPGDAADETALAAELARAGVVYGLDAHACQLLSRSLADPAVHVEGVLVATGVCSTRGADGYFSPAFEPGIQPGHVSDDGKMDFRDRELLKPVRAGEPLGVLHALRPGMPGRRVDGVELAVPQVHEAALELGPGVARAAEGRLSASIDGVILYVPKMRLDVVREHTHRGDVDYRSGNLDMAGSLRIRGDVTRSFTVRASGDVEVAGSVFDGSVHAGGSLSVRGNVQGGSEGALTAHGDVQVRSAERARIRTRSSLKIDSAVHCQLEAAMIDVVRLRGGEARAEQGLTVREAGSEHGVDTSLFAGQPLELEPDTRASLALVRDERLRLRARGSDASGARGRGGKAGRGRPALQRDQLERLVAVRRERERLLETAFILVHGVAYPGVIIQLGDARLCLTESIESTRFAYHAPSRSMRSERHFS